MNASKLLSTVALLGIGGGAVWIFGPLRTGGMAHAEHSDEQRPAARRVVESPNPSAVGFATAVTQARLAELERKVATISNKEDPALPSATAAIEVPPDPKEARREAVQAYRQLLEKHATEGVDPAWSREATAALAADLGRFADANTNKFRVGRVDCRTTTCTAEIEWPSFKDALQTFQAVVLDPIDMKCTQQITLPDEQKDTTSPYLATAFFDCEESR